MRTTALLLAICPFLNAQQFTNGASPALVPNMDYLRPGDVNGDGFPDLLGVTSSQVLLLANDGFGSFGQPHAMASFQAGQNGVIADFDGDGDGDLVTWTVSNNFGPVALHLLTNQGTSFTSQQLAQSTLQGGGSIVDIDYDGDGDLDVLAVTSGGVTYRLLLLENDGAGQFTDVSASMLPFDDPWFARGLHVLDVDGDGRSDVLFGMFAPPGATDPGLGLLRNTGTGFVDETATRLPPMPFTIIDDVTIGDLEADGDPDILAVVSSGALRLLENQNGVYVDTSASVPGVGNVGRAVFFDADRDGYDDVYVRQDQSPDGALLRNVGGTLQAPQPVPQMHIASSGGPPSIVAADLDADGDEDVFGWRSGVAALRSDSSGGLTEWWQDTRVGSVAAYGDIDNDGDVDWLGIDGTAFNDGFGGFDIVPVSFPVGVDLGDVDGDGDLDVVGYDVLLNDGTGSFTAAPGAGYPAPGPFNIIRQVRLADFDGDNDLDIAALGLFSPELTIYTNNGAGQFTQQSAISLPLSMLTLEIGDVDADQDVDLLIGGSAGVLIATNNGGTFTVGSPLSVSGRARLADLQGNGQPDIIVDGIYGGGAVRVLRRQAGLFLDVTATVIPLGTTETSVAIGDVDNDGDVDLAGAGVLRNVNGTLAPETPTLASRQHAEHLVDIDGDGDRDLIAGGFLHHNREHQVELPRPAVIGLNLRVDVWALPGRASAMEFAFVGVGTSRMLPGVALPPWGDVQIGGVLDLVNVPITPGVGAGGFDLPIPANAGLVGMELAFQCLHLGPSAELLGAAVSTFIEN